MFFHCTNVLHAFGTEDTVVLKVPLRNSENTKKVEEGEIHVLDPLSVISYLYNVIGIDIPEERVNAYWQHYRSAECGADWAKASPASDSHVPIGLYGDACRVRQGEKMTGIFMNLPLFRPQNPSAALGSSWPLSRKSLWLDVARSIASGDMSSGA